jgi:hypothetical protein
VPDIGDRVLVTLSVSPADGTTSATATARHLPDGEDTTLDVTPNAGRDVWTAQLPITALGAYRVTWTVTGTGQGIEYDTVYALGGPDPVPGESYASLTDLALYLGEEPQDGAGRLLVKASRKVDDYLIGAYYQTDTDCEPVDPRVKAALVEATCAQVEYWYETGNLTGSDAGEEQWRSVSIGNVSLSRNASGGSGGSSQQGSSGSTMPPQVEQALRRAGLLPIMPWLVG